MSPPWMATIAMSITSETETPSASVNAIRPAHSPCSQPFTPTPTRRCPAARARSGRSGSDARPRSRQRDRSRTRRCARPQPATRRWRSSADVRPRVALHLTEVQVRDAVGRAGDAELLTLRDLLTRLDVGDAVRVEVLVAVGAADRDLIAREPAAVLRVVADLHDDAALQRDHRRALGDGDVDGVVRLPVAERVRARARGADDLALLAGRPAARLDAAACRLSTRRLGRGRRRLRVTEGE